jgi:hypothetical protein
MELVNGHEARFVLLTVTPQGQKELPFDYTFQDHLGVNEK